MPSLAVVPFTHRAGDEEMASLGEDLTEEITRELAQSPYFKVIATGKMAAWRGRPIDYQALGETWMRAT
jgi:TolB-like protein